MKLDKIFVFTDFDLDGTTSLLYLHWMLGAKPGQIAYKSTTVSNFRREYLHWLTDNKPDNFDKIYILDLDVSESADLIDKKNVVVIDHHLTHVNAKEVYKNAQIHVTETSSCAKLIYKLSQEVFNYDASLLDPRKKLLVAIADDYDCYALKIKQSYELNSLLTNLQKSAGAQRADTFMNRFQNGFTEFTTQEKNIIKEHVDRKNKAISELQIYTGKVSISGRERIIYGTTGDKFVNEICDHVLKTSPADIVFFVNANNSHVSFRKSKTCDVDLSKLAAKLCEGGGHEYAAGGKITESFMNFTKLLSPVQ